MIFNSTESPSTAQESVLDPIIQAPRSPVRTSAHTHSHTRDLDLLLQEPGKTNSPEEDSPSSENVIIPARTPKRCVRSNP